MRKVCELLFFLIITAIPASLLHAVECDTDDPLPISRISISTDGTLGQFESNGDRPAISKCGDIILFTSTSTLVASDTDTNSDIYKHDTTTGITSRVLNIPGDSLGPGTRLTDDGLFYAFDSFESNLVASDNNGKTDIFLADVANESMTRINLAPDGSEADGNSGGAFITPDGQYITYHSYATNLHPMAGGTNADVYVYNTQSGITNLISINKNGNISGGANDVDPAISDDGNYVVFASNSRDLTEPAVNGQVWDIYLRDIQSSTTTRITVGYEGSVSDGSSSAFDAAISSTGRYIAFASYATNLVANDTNGLIDLFLYDRQTGKTSIIDTQGEVFGQFSFDESEQYLTLEMGRGYIFDSGETLLSSSYLVYDIALGKFRNTGVTANGEQADGTVTRGSISRDGRYISFSSFAHNLDNQPGQIDQTYNVFLAPNPYYTAPTDTTPLADGNGSYLAASTNLDPINTFNGEFFTQKKRELNLGGPMPLYFQRYYAAYLRRSFIVGDLGNNWRHNFDARLYQLPSNKYKYVTHDGRVTEFTLNQETGLWEQQTNFDTPYQITVVDGQDATIYDPTIDRIYTFDLTTDSSIIGKLIMVEDGKGNTHTISYNLANAQIQSVSDGIGRSLNFTYNNDSIPKISVVDDGNRSISFEYTDPNDTENLTVATDANLRPTLFVYEDTSTWTNNFGLMSYMTRAEGNSPYVQTYYDDTNPLTSGRVAIQTDADGNTYQLEYNDLETTLTDPLNNTRVHTHTATGEFASRQDENGLTFTMGSDNAGRRNSLTDRLGDTTSATFNAASGDLESLTNADGTSYSFDHTERMSSGFSFQDLTNISHADGTTESIAYDAFGNPTSHTNQLGDVSTKTFNNFGQVLTSTNAQGGVTSVIYNADATLASRTDSANNTTTFAYDAFRRLNQYTHADLNSVSFTRDNIGNLLTKTDENGNTATSTYDLNSNLRTVQDALMQTSSLAYDGNDRLISLTNPLGATNSQTFNSIGKLASVTDANGNTTSYAYNPLGRRTSVTEPLGNVWTTTYDLEGIVASVTTPLLKTITFTSDSMGRITQVMSPLGNTVDTVYDEMGRVSSTTNGLGETTTYSRDTRGLLSAISLPNNLISASYTRNKLGLITSIIDPGGNSWDRTYDNSGRLTSYTDPLGQLQTMTYDNRNRLNTTTYPNTLGTQSLSYDAVGNLISNTYSDGTTLIYSYDAKNRLTSANGLSLGYNTIDRLVSSNGIGVIRDSGSRITQLTLAPGKVVTYAYDANNRLIQVTDWLGGVTTFSYDAVGKLTNISRPNGVNTTNGYDIDDQLVSLSEGNLSSIELTRNAKGEISSAIRNVPLVASVSALNNKVNAVDAASQLDGSTYDALGRTLTDGTNTFVWDLNNRLTSLTNSAGTTTYAYDAMGNRLTKTNAGGTQSFVWNYALGLPSISVEKVDGTDTVHYVHTPSGSLLYAVKATTNARQFYHYDELGNTLFVTDDSGSIIASYAYTPFGKLIAETGTIDNPYKWQGQFGVMHEGNGFYYIRARYYDSSNARFISRDTFNSINPMKINPYQYALANPMSFIDVTGRDALSEAMTTLAISEADYRVVKNATPIVEVEVPYIDDDGNAGSYTVHWVTEKFRTASKKYNDAISAVNRLKNAKKDAGRDVLTGNGAMFIYMFFVPHEFHGYESPLENELDFDFDLHFDDTGDYYESERTKNNVIYTQYVNGISFVENTGLNNGEISFIETPVADYEQSGWLRDIVFIDITLPDGTTYRESIDLHDLWNQPIGPALASNFSGDLQWV